MNTKEYEIPMPWGHVAAKAWGDDKNPYVLCFHGILDNAGSFDRLIPQLHNCYYYICIDLPGHGLSTHFPQHLPLYNMDNIIVYMLVAKYFKKQRYIVIGHSYGGQLAFLFAQLYPEIVERLVMLDTISMFPISSKIIKSYIIDKYETFLRLNEKLETKNQPEYTYEEALLKVQLQRQNGDISKEAAEALLQRNIKKTTNGKYVFTLDQRLKNFTVPLHDIRYQIENLSINPVTCRVCIILGTDSTIQQMLLKKTLLRLMKMKTIKVIKVEGGHDVHITNPENVAPFVNQFLIDKRKKL